ncbi:MAG: response regulator transcription factor [Calditrichaeota bacterium]|nr:response regulator transcription factor [Calditrichota bacterium]
MTTNTVVIIEDEPEFRQVLVDLINSLSNFECQANYDNFESFVNSLSHVKAPDILVTDINLPGISGIEGIREIHSDYPELLIIILTVFNDEQKIFEALKAGAISYLLKSEVSNNLEEIFSIILNGGAYMSPSIALKISEYFKNQTALNKLKGLTGREYEVIDLLITGNKYQEIGDQLCLSLDTIRYHIKNIYKKLHVNSRSEIAELIKNKKFH